MVWNEPEGVTADKEHKILWDFTIQCNSLIKARRSDIFVVNKGKKKETTTIDIAILRDVSINDKGNCKTVDDEESICHSSSWSNTRSTNNLVGGIWQRNWNESWASPKTALLEAAKLLRKIHGCWMSLTIINTHVWKPITCVKGMKAYNVQERYESL